MIKRPAKSITGGNSKLSQAFQLKQPGKKSIPVFKQGTHQTRLGQLEKTQKKTGPRVENLPKNQVSSAKEDPKTDPLSKEALMEGQIKAFQAGMLEESQKLEAKNQKILGIYEFIAAGKPAPESWNPLASEQKPHPPMSKTIPSADASFEELAHLNQVERFEHFYKHNKDFRSFHDEVRTTQDEGEPVEYVPPRATGMIENCDADLIVIDILTGGARFLLSRGLKYAVKKTVEKSVTKSAQRVAKNFTKNTIKKGITWVRKFPGDVYRPIARYQLNRTGIHFSGGRWRVMAGLPKAGTVVSNKLVDAAMSPTYWLAQPATQTLGAVAAGYLNATVNEPGGPTHPAEAIGQTIQLIETLCKDFPKASPEK